MGYLQHAASLHRHIAVAPFTSRLAELNRSNDQAMHGAVIDEASRFAEAEIEPLGCLIDEIGARLVDGRVHTPEQHKTAWRAFREMGWLSMSAPGPDGQELPLHVVVACEELFNRASAAFTMLHTSTRCGASLLLEYADEEVKARWVPRLLSGEWGATICISEPEAGSDVGRIRTRARLAGGHWSVTGEKCWISFGDHDLTANIGHLMLARTSDDPGVRGLSLFLVPARHEDGSPNGVSTRRIEHKLGLRGSPTCVLGFQDAQAILLGSPGRGLNAMFRMMLDMRLACGPQGTGVAAAALDVALGYAVDRLQGGAPDQRPIPISHHPDIQRELLAMAAQVELTRGLNIACAQVLDLSRQDDDEARRETWSAVAQVLLPIVKDSAAWCAVEVSSRAIQVLGGAGFTSEWPVERLYRDARVFPIFEGTSGIQALDLLHRRVWRDGRAGIDVLLDLVRQDAEDLASSDPFVVTLDLLDRTVGHLANLRSTPRAAEAGAAALLELFKLTALGWIATRLRTHAGTDPVGLRLNAVAAFFLSELATRAALAHGLALRGYEPLTGFTALVAD